MTEDGKKGIEDKEEKQDSSKKKVSNDEIKELKNKLNKLVPKISNSEINYFLLYYDSKKRPVCLPANISTQVGKYFANSLKSTIDLIYKSDVVDFNNSDAPSEGTVEITYMDMIPNMKIISSIIESSHNTNWDKSKINNITGLKFVVKHGELTAFGSLSKKNLMEKSLMGKLISMTASGTFDQVKEKVLYEIPDMFSAITYKDYTFILDEHSVDSILKYHEKMLEKIRSKAKINNELFSDPDMFINALESDQRKARKVHLVYENQSIDNFEAKDIIAYANKYNLDVKLDKQNKLDLKNSNMWHVVRAISEDYYTGELTKLHYGAKSKENI